MFSVHRDKTTSIARTSICFSMQVTSDLYYLHYQTAPKINSVHTGMVTIQQGISVCCTCNVCACVCAHERACALCVWGSGCVLCVCVCVRVFN